jgi:hypothetical protein
MRQSSGKDQDQKDHYIYLSEYIVYEFDPVDLDPFLKNFRGYYSIRDLVSDSTDF